jgi:hypothetical protein
MNGKVIDGRPLTVSAATARGGAENDDSKVDIDNSWKTAPPPRNSKQQGRGGGSGRGGGGASQGGARAGSDKKSWTDWASPTASMGAKKK